MAGRMIAESASQKRPMHPGELFKREILPALDLSITEAARRLRVSRQTLHRMMAGAHAITPEMALRLGRFCGNGPHLWLRLQQNYDLWNVEHRDRAEIEQIPMVRTIGDLPDARTGGTVTTEMIAGEGQSEDEIGNLYDEIADLTEKLSQLDDHALPARSLIEAQIGAAYAELRRLQTQEAEHFRRAFEASLELPLGEGSRILQEARTLISALEQIVGTSGDEQTPATAEPPAAARPPAAATARAPAAAEAPAEAGAPAAVEPSAGTVARAP